MPLSPENLNVHIFQDLQTLSLQITEVMTFILNDPSYYCKQIYKFFGSHQLFQIMPVVQKFRKVNKKQKEESDGETLTN
jgi:hypothetical protein